MQSNRDYSGSRPFGRLMAEELTPKQGTEIKDQGHFMSVDSGSAWTDEPDTADPGFPF